MLKNGIVIAVTEQIEPAMALSFLVFLIYYRAFYGTKI